LPDRSAKVETMLSAMLAAWYLTKWLVSNSNADAASRQRLSLYCATSSWTACFDRVTPEIWTSWGQRYCR
jgi:hypothetical protein